MSITIAYLASTLNLDDDLQWVDEADWAPVEQTIQRTVTGAMIVSAASRIGGRPITLRPPDDGSAWMSRATLDQLRSWAAVAGRQMTLTLLGATYTVVFRHQDGNAIEARPVVFYNDVENTDWYLVTLRFTEIQ